MVPTKNSQVQDILNPILSLDAETKSIPNRSDGNCDPETGFVVCLGTDYAKYRPGTGKMSALRK
jgi:hypothetical protein